MSIEYLKKAAPVTASQQDDVRQVVERLLSEIDVGGEEAARALARKFDNWDGEIVVAPEQIDQAIKSVPQRLKDDIRFAHDNIRRFAEAQKATLSACEVEIVPGFVAGQKIIPIASAGCYVPGGRYSHIASAIMTITTAKVAGVSHITATSPPKPGIGIPPEVLSTMNLCGADRILNLGGVQGIAAMALGLFGSKAANILVGPGNAYVAEAKRLLFGEVGIDMFAGPTDSMVIADESADPQLVAWDLVGQAEHGADSPVWLVTTDRALANSVMSHVDGMISALPLRNGVNARDAWGTHAEVILCDSREEMVEVADRYAPEHLQVQARDLDWFLEHLSAYGSLFLGEETTVAYGDKSSGPNHVLPTSGAAKYTGGLSVHKFLKIVTWQRGTKDGARAIAEATARISRTEGVAISVSLGGPGALFWLFVAGLMGMTTKFVECSLGVKYRVINPDGSVSGGPMYYLRDGLAGKGRKHLGKVLGLIYAVSLVVGCLGSGNMFQSNQAYAQILFVTGGEESLLTERGWLVGLIMAICVGLFVIGGIKSIARATSKLVPFMVLLYVVGALTIIAINFTALPGALAAIVAGAFSMQGVTGGVLGVMIIGFQRAAFSNEAGIGSAAVAHSAVRTKKPMTEGFVALLEPFVDTVVICTLTGLVLVTSLPTEALTTDGLSGIELTSSAFESKISWSPVPLSLAAILFAFSTLLAWAYYGMKAWTYLFGAGRSKALFFNFIFCVFIVIGASVELDAILGFSDAMVFVMSVPNIIGLYILAPEVKRDLAAYLSSLNPKTQNEL
eukprot:g3407.t1